MPASTIHDVKHLSQAMEKSKHDLNAFTPIYETFAGRIYSYCRHRVGSSQDAEDLTAEIFARAMSKCHTYRGGSVGAWLFRIAYHMTVDFYRSKKVTTVSDEVLNTMSDTGQRSPLEIVIQKERQGLLQELVDSLTEEKRNLLLLRITGELSSAEIGEIVGKNAGSVRVELHRIIQELKLNAVEEQ